MVASPTKASHPMKGPRGRRPPPRTKPESQKVKGKKKTSKKPKHLKRKLETASDVAEQERIRKQMELLEATKRTLSHQKQSSTIVSKGRRGSSVRGVESSQQQPKQFLSQKRQLVLDTGRVMSSASASHSEPLASSPPESNNKTMRSQKLEELSAQVGSQCQKESASALE